VIIAKQHRGKKLAKEMIKQSEEFCRLNYSYEELCLNVDSENTSAIELYKSLGYQVTHQHKTMITMKKKLKTNFEYN
jgi:ribosomal protein S18 acetylase RimI-like enzyme